MAYETEQEAFWAGSFGDAYLARNQGERMVGGDTALFARALAHAHALPAAPSVLEFGANIGLNLRALRHLYPSAELNAVEIHEAAARTLDELLGPGRVFHGSIFDYPVARTFDLVLSKGVLIHIAPEKLPAMYDALHAASHRYIFLGEYYNPVPVAVSYRGHAERLWKRDFAGEMLDRFADLRVVDYGFAWRRDARLAQDDITWFLLEKTAPR